MPVRSSQPSIIKTQEFFNRIASITNNSKDRLGVFDFSHRLDLLNLWNSVQCYWPMLENQNIGLTNNIYGIKDYFDAQSTDGMNVIWQQNGVYLDGDDFLNLEQNETQAIFLEEENGKFLSTKNNLFNIGNYGDSYDPKENSFMLVTKPDANTNYTGSFNLRSTGSFKIGLDKIYDSTDQLCILNGLLLEDTNFIATNCYFNTYKFWSTENNGTLDVQLSTNNDLDFVGIVYTNEGGVNGNKLIQFNDRIIQTTNTIQSSSVDFYGISFDTENNRWIGNVCFYIQFSVPQLSSTIDLYTAYKETLGRSLDLPNTLNTSIEIIPDGPGLVWTFPTVTGRTITGFSVTTTSGTILVDWGDNTSNTINSGSLVNKTY
jgi:hypothetical protein